MPIEKLTRKRVESICAAGVRTQVSDSMARGLVLRVESESYWTWNVRRSVQNRDHRMDLTSVWSLDEARELALEIDRRVRAKRDPWVLAPQDWARHFEERRRVKLDLPKPVYAPPPFEHVVPKGPRILWPDAVREFLTDCAGHLRPKTVDDYRKSLAVAEFRRFLEEYVGAITVEMVATAVDDIRRRGVEKHVNRRRSLTPDRRPTLTPLMSV